MDSTQQFAFDRPVHCAMDTSGWSRLSLHNLISARAYQLFENRGRAPGRDPDDWFQAEREVRHHLSL